MLASDWSLPQVLPAGFLSFLLLALPASMTTNCSTPHMTSTCWQSWHAVYSRTSICQPLHITPAIQQDLHLKLHATFKPRFGALQHVAVMGLKACSAQRR